MRLVVWLRSVTHLASKEEITLFLNHWFLTFCSHPELAVQTELLHPDITSLVCYGTYSISPTLSRPQAYQGLKGNPPLQGGEVVSLWKHSASVQVPRGKQGPGVSQADGLTAILREALGHIAGNVEERSRLPDLWCSCIQELARKGPSKWPVIQLFIETRRQEWWSRMSSVMLMWNWLKNKNKKIRLAGLFAATKPDILSGGFKGFF